MRTIKTLLTSLLVAVFVAAGAYAAEGVGAERRPWGEAVGTAFHRRPRRHLRGVRSPPVRDYEEGEIVIVRTFGTW